MGMRMAQAREFRSRVRELDVLIASYREAIPEIDRLEAGEDFSRARARWLVRLALLEQERGRLTSELDR